ncbi:hypothetical protein [Rhizobium sp. AN80A]|uniref:hypothetical protein n=1 Tax=Rhizobium sp. AN80A TaxID=3040673 RepID=UPI0024B3520C|nr:hypothetical protein [Rhizobium sp. AN80A]
MVENIFAQARRRQRDAEIEFRHFKALAMAEIDTLKAANPRFEALDAYFGFHVDNRDDIRLELRFGRRSMFRKDYDGKQTATEDGASLLYSLGAMGDIATILYPAKSTFGKTEEDFVFRGIGPRSGHQVFGSLKRDFDDLVAYAYVSSIEAETTWWERRRIGWLRFVSAMRVGDKHEAPKIKALMGGASKSLMLAFLTALMRPIAIVLVAALLVWLGKDIWIDLLRGKA